MNDDRMGQDRISDDLENGEESEARFQLAEWTVEPSLLRLRRGEETRGIGAKVMGVLQSLARRAGQVVSKDELVRQVWGGDAASDEALAAVVCELRRALGDDARTPRFIGTIRGRGYRLLLEPAAVPFPEESAVALERTALGISAPEITERENLVVAAPTRVAARFETGGFRVSPTALLAALLLAAIGLLVSARLDFAPPTPAEVPTSVGGGAIRSLAVTALEARGARMAEDASLFARGLSEHLAIDLARSDWLEVVPTFSRALGGPSPRLSSGRVDAAVEGSVRRHGDRLLVTVQLIAADGQLLWGGSWERAADDLTALELELSDEIAGRLRGRLGGARVARSPEVDDALRLGRHFLDSGAPAEARRYFSLALERQPTLAPAHVGLADALLQSADEQPREQRRSTVAEARRAAEAALVIDAELPAAHASLGAIALVHEGDLATAADHFARLAEELLPLPAVSSLDDRGFRHSRGGGNIAADLAAPSSSLRAYAGFLSATGRHRSAIDVLRQAVRRSPMSLGARLELARALYLGERYDEALAALARLAELAPGDARTARLRGEILLVQGEHRAAVEACREAVALAGGAGAASERIAEVFDRHGLEGVVRCLRDLAAGEHGPAPSPDLYAPLHLARIDAVRGDADAALSWLALARQQRAPGLAWLGVDPAFSSLRGLDAFAELVAAPRAAV